MQICERSLTSSTGGPAGPPTTCFVRADMLPSGYLIRPCDGGGSIINIVDHMDLNVSSKCIYYLILLVLCRSILFSDFLYFLALECARSFETSL